MSSLSAPSSNSYVSDFRCFSSIDDRPPTLIKFNELDVIHPTIASHTNPLEQKLDLLPGDNESGRTAIIEMPNMNGLSIRWEGFIAPSLAAACLQQCRFVYRFSHKNMHNQL